MNQILSSLRQAQTERLTPSNALPVRGMQAARSDQSAGWLLAGANMWIDLNWLNSHEFFNFYMLATSIPSMTSAELRTQLRHSMRRVRQLRLACMALGVVMVGLITGLVFL